MNAILIVVSILGIIGMWRLINFGVRSANRSVASTEATAAATAATADALQAIYDALPMEAQVRGLENKQKRIAIAKAAKSAHRTRMIIKAVVVCAIIVLLVYLTRP
jgi:hypothetical protein